MAPNVVALCTCIALLFFLAYFLMALVPFLFVKLTEPTVAFLFRGLFRNCFLLIAGAGGIAAIAFIVTGNPVFAIGVALFSAFDIAARRWFLQRLDTQWSANAAGDGMAPRRLRRLHLSGMGVILAQLAIVIGSITFVV